MATANPRFILLGGFLGAGKTTLIAQLAKHYISQGKRVGIVTNDQAADLVDTHTLRGQGFDVGEVAGACFCCSFNDLVATADRLDAEAKPDILLAEPVGSCTDLIATVIMPLEQLYTTKFEIAPYGVLLKPSHGRRILSSGKRSGFSPQAEYIFNKQLEEADFLMIGRADQLSEQEAEELEGALRESAPGVPIVRVSPKTGAGVDDVIQQIENHEQRPHRVLEIDYDIYAEGEAELGWVNLSADLFAPNQIDLDRLVVDTVTGAGSAIAKAGGEIAHLKAAAMGDGIHAVANIVASGDKAEQALVAGREVAGQIQLIVNARVAMDPQELESIARAAVKESASHQLVETRDQHAHSLRPGRPVPTHRMS